MENNYVYVCGFYDGDRCYKLPILKVCVSEIDAVNEMMRLCKSDESDGFKSSFENCDFDNLNIETYQQFNDFVKNNCNSYYDDFVFYPYIQKVILE